MYCYTKDGFEEISGKLLIMGDSISDDGRYVSFINMWLSLYAKNENISISNLGVCSETVSGLSEPDHPFPRPTAINRLQHSLDLENPNWVILCYGINDGIYYPFSEERFEAFKKGYKKVIDTVHTFGAKAVVLTPPPFDAISFTAAGNVLQPLGLEKYSYMAVYENYNQVMQRYTQWVKDELSKYADCIVDVNTALSEDTALLRKDDQGYISGDGIHPNLHGHWVMAKTILVEFFGVLQDFGEQVFMQNDYELFNKIYKRDTLFHYNLKETVGHDNLFKSDYLEGDELLNAVATANQEIEKYICTHDEMLDYITDWNGYTQHILHFEGYEVRVAEPHAKSEGNPWVWRAEFFGAFPSVDLAMLEKGWYAVQISISHQFGTLNAIEIMERFFHFVTEKYNLNKKAAMFGFSRGGLYALHYAAKYPNNVRSLYLDAPVVDIRSWPGGKGKGLGSRWDWERCLKAFSLKEETADNFVTIMQAAILNVVSSNVHTLIVAGDSDDVVPFYENGQLIVDEYQKHKKAISVILKKGIGHHPHSLQDPAQVVEFLMNT